MSAGEILDLAQTLLAELDSNHCSLHPDTRLKMRQKLRFILLSSAYTMDLHERLRLIYDFLSEFEQALRNTARLEGLLESLLLHLNPSFKNRFSPKPTPGGGPKSDDY